MGMFDSKPKITPKEFDRAMGKLYSDGLTKHDRNDVRKIFGADLFEEGRQRGITSDEIETRMKYAREHKSEHSLSEEQLKKVESTLKGKL